MTALLYGIIQTTTYYNLSSDLRLRRQLTDKQLVYLSYHRAHVYRSGEQK